MSDQANERGPGAALASGELEVLARKHAVSVEEVKRVIAETGSRSRERIEAVLEERYARVRPGVDNAGVEHPKSDGDAIVGRHNEEAPGLRGVTD